MPEYRRRYVPGGTYFLTLVTYQRQNLFSKPENVDRLRKAIARTKIERPFEIIGAVVLPDHIHFLWKLPELDSNFSYRVARMKVLFTRSYQPSESVGDRSVSRQKHREKNVWQRRFWEHTIRDERDFRQHLDYIHYNPVKHGLVTCPHFWKYSSLHQWISRGKYDLEWGCVCGGRRSHSLDFTTIADRVGE